ncbi:MAG TPA: TetR family transcriptional regulator [Streptosporangiaceae bacterium]
MPRTTAQGAPPASMRDRQRHREELIEIARHIFAEKGFDGATLQDVADQFGVLKGSCSTTSTRSNLNAVR